VRHVFSVARDSPILDSIGIGETAYVCVHANKLWNDSGIDVAWGQRYTFSVARGEKWIGGQRTCGPDGYLPARSARLSKFLRRVPEARRFQLIGAVGRSTKSAIIIGHQLPDFLVLFPGRLYLFANDLAWMYWNNEGMLAVRIKRTK